MVVLTSFPMGADDQQILGFPGKRTVEQRELERRFDSYLRSEDLQNWMKYLSARPHHVGSPYGSDVADFLASQFKMWGYDTEIEEFQVLFPTPKTRVLEMLEPSHFRASLEEPSIEEDSTSSQKDEQLPTYNAYSVDGDVEGELVYVNYGVPNDYEELKRRGIDVTGKIVIARYGGSWRGIKPKVAWQYGAIGCIIYSDPKDDGYFLGDIYPNGPYRMDQAVQRGSVVDMPLYPGDPLTPNVGATKEAARIELTDAATLTKIPVLPISYADATPFLKSLGGPSAPESWRGALPITYHLGPGPTKVHLKLEFNWDLAPIYNVIARMDGFERPSQWIIRGNHHDAWVNGARDPVSGLVALMAEARAIGELTKTGWRPNRTIVFAAWDAEEPGLLGSTEWVELHADVLRSHAVAYINTDGNSRGFLNMAGSHTLEKFVNEIARDVTDPQTHISVSERLHARRLVLAEANGQDVVESSKGVDHRISALGSGSDYTPFLQHLGIASLNLSYSGEAAGGSYHSIFDSFDYYTRFSDPEFAYGIALAQTAGRAVLRLAEAEMLPFDFVAFSQTVSRYADEIKSLLDGMRKKTESRNRLSKEKRYLAAADPTQTYIAPIPQDPVPYINFASLQNALVVLKQTAEDYDRAMNILETSGLELSESSRKSLDEILMNTERALTLDSGLPRRSWFTHQIYAPGFYTGYGVKTFPGVREAIEERRWEEASQQVEVLAKTIERFANEVDRARTVLIQSQ